ncbi:DUF2500 family protein [Paenibacillus polymyxa]|uniref:DUF2500 family protein n=1 Tax=Paenibacillus polymyxa TaxID=1406 RepID=UPI00287FAB98|nr:DUF2500 family protein [Paenibacillus polymyxa]
MQYLLGFLSFIAFLVILIWVLMIPLNREEARNLKKPKIERVAKVVDKRMNWLEDSSVRYYYFTCEFQDGSREEIKVSESEYGVIIVGDFAKIIQQGTSIKAERVVV